MKKKNKEAINRCVSFEEDLNNSLKDFEFQKEYLNISFEEYLEDKDFNHFFQSLKKVIKARESVSSFAKNANIDRAHLYKLFNGEKKPQLETITKILKALGLSLKIA